MSLDEEMNDEAFRDELDLVEEIRSGAGLHEATLKQEVAVCHDNKVIKRKFQVGNLVLRRNLKDSRKGKLAVNWEGLTESRKLREPEHITSNN